MDKALQLYLHIPFCISTCSYCNSFTLAGDHQAHEAYLDALAREIDSAADSYADREVQSVYIGGGSPTCMNPDHMAKVVRLIRKRFNLKEHCEVSIEAMPQTIGTPSLSSLNVAHITRYSLSMQSSNDADLQALDCSFKSMDVRNAGLFLEKFHLANINLDLMYGFAAQTEESLRDTVKTASAVFQAPHISLYPFGGPEDKRLSDETRRSYYNTARAMLESAGYHQYSAYHFAHDNRICDHFIQRYGGIDYLGFGMGARTLVDGITYVNTTDWDTYIASSDDISKTAKDIIELSPLQLRENHIRERLNLTEGIDLNLYVNKYGTAFKSDYSKLFERMGNDVRFIVDDSHIAIDPAYLCDIEDIEASLLG